MSGITSQQPIFLILFGSWDITPLGGVNAGFPPIREIRENFEDFFQSGKSEKQGVFSQNQRKKFQIREVFSKPFSNLLI